MKNKIYKIILRRLWTMALAPAVLVWILVPGGHPVATFCSDSGSCSFSEVCSGGRCVDSASANCASKSAKKCYDNDVYWYDSCGAREEQAQDCGTDSYVSEYKCSSTMVQQKVIARGCDGGECKEANGWIDLQNCADKKLECRGGVCRAADATPPIIYYLLPSGAVNNPSVELSLTTNEASECHYGYYDVSFDQMGMKFNSVDGLRHTAPTTLTVAGTYTFFVRCRDEDGNVNLASGKISFTYGSGSQQLPRNGVVAEKDTTPPAIQASSLSPSGQVASAAVELSLKTNEKSSCRFDVADTAYASMENAFNGDAAGITHHKTVTLAGAGRYAYYVRCKDASGNTDTESSLIEFEFAGGVSGTGLAISDTKPSGVVYQKSVALEVTTGSPANCRYSAVETDFDSMEDLFSTNDGLRHLAVVTVEDYGGYSYNVVCRDSKNAPKKSEPTQISFQYKDPNKADLSAGAGNNCQTFTAGTGDGNCNAAADCVCDPDCSGRDGAVDPDCSGGPKVIIDYPPVLGWIIMGAVGFALIAGISFVFRRFKKGGGEEAGENEDESLGL
jgi:hypothetical protein